MNDSLKRAGKLLFVFGTRPEAIKMAPVYLRFIEDGTFDVDVCVTAQHRQMLDQVLSFFEIAPTYDLNLMTAGQTLNAVFSGVLNGLDEILAKNSYDAILVHGDTTTSSAAALAAFHRKVPVFHVEAGLRTFNMMSPWPEEMNRSMTGMLATLHFAPTIQSQKNLLALGAKPEAVVVTGNSVVDAVSLASAKIDSDSVLHKTLAERFSFLRSDKKVILVTSHRRENFGQALENICDALLAIAARGDTQIVYPVHLNPNVLDVVRARLGANANVVLLEPVDYASLVYLIKKSYLILTDSGGIQEEAPTFEKPVLVMRETTERPEAIEQGSAKLVGTEKDAIVATTFAMLDNVAGAYTKMQKAGNPYGDGTTSQKILASVKKWRAK